MSDVINFCSKPESLLMNGSTKNLLIAEKTKYIKYKLLCDVINECLNETNALKDELICKVKNIQIIEECRQINSLTDNTKLFGATLKCSDLSYREQDCLKLNLEIKLANKLSKFPNLNEFNSYSSRLEEFELNPHDARLVSMKSELHRTQHECLDQLQIELRLLQEVAQMRTRVLPEVMRNKLRESQAVSRISNLKARITEWKFRVDVFSETRSALEAFKLLIADVKEEQRDCSGEIKRLEDLKEEYRLVDCKQYDDILKSYLQYKANIAKKKLLYETSRL